MDWGKRLKTVLLVFGIVIVNAFILQDSHAASQVRMWKSQSVYVPVYSYIFLSEEKKIRLKLITNVSIRNTDSRNAITLTAVDYYNTDGSVEKKYLTDPVILKPMSSVYFVVEAWDLRGGWGANFIVDWKASAAVTEPLIESIHSGARGNQSYSFISRGKAVKGVYE